MSSLSLFALQSSISAKHRGLARKEGFLFQPLLLYPSYSFLGSYKLCRWLLSKQGALGEGSLLASGDHLLTPSSCLLFKVNQLRARANYHTAVMEAQKGVGEARQHRAKLTGRRSPNASLTLTEPGLSAFSGVCFPQLPGAEPPFGQ